MAGRLKLFSFISTETVGSIDDLTVKLSSHQERMRLSYGAKVHKIRVIGNSVSHVLWYVHIKRLRMRNFSLMFAVSIDSDFA